ncbi:unnamed protein product [Rotaria sordida]|uniref:Transmembrane protein n=1 Tax=Rotaria sordida TaxID=392033 RepID=A0A815K0B5_9BILA|nr:unnamed protein product [Rotaria sordida]CAF1619540.1 unnamed protein product [Rotaria sordida]
MLRQTSLWDLAWFASSRDDDEEQSAIHVNNGKIIHDDHQNIKIDKYIIQYLNSKDNLFLQFLLLNVSIRIIFIILCLFIISTTY